MTQENTYAVILTELEMRTVLETINKTAYLGQVSDTVSSLREKLDPDQQKPIKMARKKRAKPAAPALESVKSQA
jgi:hypothetical protein